MTLETPRAHPTPVATSTVRKGPVPLDPKLFGLVAGGLPRGTWTTTGTDLSTTTSALPRGTW